jgi:hypothetical protein
MNYFDRVCSIDVSPDIRLLGGGSNELRISFEIKKSILSNVNYARVDVYNLSQATRNRISNDALGQLIVKAGYAQNVGLVQIGQGNIGNVVHNVISPNIITSIYCKDGFKAIKNNNIAISFSENTPLSRVIDAIVGKMGLPVKYANYDKSAFFKTGYCYVGTVSEAMEDLSKQFNFDWSIQNGEVQILKRDTSTNIQSVYLSAETGLIESPKRFIKLKGISRLERNQHEIVALLQPQLEVGDMVQVNSTTLTGNFRVEEFTHFGDTHGNDWLTKILVTG